MSMGTMMGRLLPALGGLALLLVAVIACGGDEHVDAVVSAESAASVQRIFARLRGCPLSPPGHPSRRLRVFPGTAAQQPGVLLGGPGGGVRHYGSDAAGGSLHQRRRDVRAAPLGHTPPHLMCRLVL